MAVSTPTAKPPNFPAIWYIVIAMETGILVHTIHTFWENDCPLTPKNKECCYIHTHMDHITTIFEA